MNRDWILSRILEKTAPEARPAEERSYRQHDGKVILCWKFGIFNRIKILLTGSVWMEIVTEGMPLQPTRVTSKIPCPKEMVNHVPLDLCTAKYEHVVFDRWAPSYVGHWWRKMSFRDDVYRKL